MKKPDFEDDGRVIAPMDGVPQSSLDAAGWFGRLPGHLPGRRAQSPVERPPDAPPRTGRTAQPPGPGRANRR